MCEGVRLAVEFTAAAIASQGLRLCRLTAREMSNGPLGGTRVFAFG